MSAALVMAVAICAYCEERDAGERRDQDGDPICAECGGENDAVCANCHDDTDEPTDACERCRTCERCGHTFDEALPDVDGELLCEDCRDGSDCGHCYGSGGGYDAALQCRYCGGTGRRDAEADRDAYLEWRWEARRDAERDGGAW